MTFTKEQRAEQLKKCCETIIDNADKIAEGFDLNKSFSVKLNFECQALPVITVEQEFISKKMLDCLNKK